MPDSGENSGRASEALTWRERTACARLGGLAVASGLLGLAAWYGYAVSAWRGLKAALGHDMVEAYRMARYAGGFQLAQWVLVMLAIGLAGITSARAEGSKVAQGLAMAAGALGVLGGVLMFVIV